MNRRNVHRASDQCNLGLIRKYAFSYQFILVRRLRRQNWQLCCPVDRARNLNRRRRASAPQCGRSPFDRCRDDDLPLTWIYPPVRQPAQRRRPGPEPGGKCRGWFGQGRPSGACHHAGQPVNALTGKMVLRFFVVCAAVQAAQDGILAPIGDRERATVLPFNPFWSAFKLSPALCDTGAQTHR